MNKKQFHYYFIPVFIAIYFLLAYLPIISKQKGEIFPFFSFKLYSKTPNEYATYDILYNRGEDNECFLLHRNSTLNKLERKNFRYRINILGQEFEESKKLFANNYADILSRGKTAFLVKISGDYVETIKNNDFDVEEIKRMK